MTRAFLNRLLTIAVGFVFVTSSAADGLAEVVNPRLKCGVTMTRLYADVQQTPSDFGSKKLDSYIDQTFPVGMPYADAIRRADLIALTCKQRSQPISEQTTGADMIAICTISDLPWLCRWWNPHAGMVPGVNLYSSEGRLVSADLSWHF